MIFCHAQQNVLITDNNTTVPHASSLLELNSLNKGLLITGFLYKTQPMEQQLHLIKKIKELEEENKQLKITNSKAIEDLRSEFEKLKASILTNP
jgi:hypothetical protein